MLPLPLPEGGRIGICAPAGPVKPERLQAAIAALQQTGFEVIIAPSAFAQSGLFSAPDDVRCKELEDMFTRKDVDAVFCARGGVGSSRLLEILNTELLVRSQKPFLGFSDITALQWHLFGKHGFVSFSGPLAVEWDGSVNEATQKQAIAMMRGIASEDLLKGFPRTNLKVLRGSGCVQGRLFPGNLTMITTLLGTPYLPDLRGAMLLIEDVHEPPHRVDRMLFHLRNAGVLSRIAGLFAGELDTGMNAEERSMIAASLRDATRGMTYPVVMGFPFGHGPERMTLPVGGLVEWNPDSMSLGLCESVTRERLT
ncbi:LD-carboxypeptidase [candidate division KSB1 bacterium]|nr:MAG: LD-carboxypeptidase [candidate division KSB1 bacterium]